MKKIKNNHQTVPNKKFALKDLLGFAAVKKEKFVTRKEDEKTSNIVIRCTSLGKV